MTHFSLTLDIPQMIPGIKKNKVTFDNFSIF